MVSLNLRSSVLFGQAFLIFVDFTLGSSISPDNKKIYHDISAGRGLYSNFPKVVNLNSATFRPSIYNNSNGNAWLVEFYNSWCGHCHRFSPVWKQFALDIYGWKDVVAVGAVDCSNSANTPLCRELEIMYYPLVKYFPPFPANNFLGTPVKVGSVEHLINSTLEILRQDVSEGTVNQPVLLPYNGKISDIWSGVHISIQYIITVLQKNDTYLGESIALDLLNVPNIKVLIVFDSNLDAVSSLSPSTFPSVFIIDRKNIVTPVLTTDYNRFKVYSSIREELAKKGIDVPVMSRDIVPVDINIDISEVMAVMEDEEKIKRKLNLNDLSDVVFQIDLDGAIRHSLRVEVPSRKSISGEALVALNSYLKTLIDHFPFGNKGQSYLNHIYAQIKDLNSTSGSDFMKIVVESEELYSPFLSVESGWLGCRGSHPQFRGYPCSLWTLFHTLTVHADQAREADGKRVLRTMLGYIKHFFGCTDCSQHFQQMAVTFEGNVTSTEDAVLWLWKAHNSVNQRLKSDPTEDPAHPKVQFPPQSICRACHTNHGMWNERVVLPFLRSMYSNISYFIIDTPTTTPESIQPAKMLKHENIANENTVNYSVTESKSFLGHFNYFDVSLFVTLYIFSMAIILMVCLKFLFKKTYKKKAYAYDIFQKV